MAAACQWPGCPALLAERGYCAKHQDRGIKLDNERNYRSRDPAVRRVYASSRWKRTRKRIIDRAGGVCERCGEAFVSEIHHVQKLKSSPELAFEEANLRGLCRPCHEIEERAT
jgi:5-methylcytosine-specific restriction endonuclease McrA